MRNSSGSSFPLRDTLHALVEQQVNRTPDAIAVRFNDKFLTYAALNERANRLAHHLRSLGAAPGEVVGIALPRSIDMIVTVLAVLKSGAGYLPLDLGYPASRLKLMLDDSGIALLICHAAGDVPFDFNARFVEIGSDTEGDSEVLAMQPSHNPVALNSSSDLAYLIFTSGSTGKPKGVEISHRNAVNLVFGMRECFDIGSGDVLLAIVSLSFDISVFDIFVPLCNGACVSVAPKSLTLSPGELFKTFEEHKITYVFSTPATFKLMLDAGLPQLPRLTTILGGDVVPTDLGEGLLERVKSVWIVYGPTEVTVLCTAGEYRGGRAYLGDAIANTEILILDQNGFPSAEGEIGELCVAGEGVGRGYRNRPDLTADKFIVSKQTDAPFDRYYKTGDLARYDSSGNLEFHGRIDRQVKIRGYRVEIGEVETLLRSHPLVLDAVVIPLEGSAGFTNLAAYYVARRLEGRHADPLTSFRNHLRSQLPEFMLPAVFIQIAELPLDQNGKVDRRALPAPIASHVVPGQLHAPRDELEKTIAGIWSEELDRPDIDIHENFFEIGGHSLMAVNVTLKIEERVGFVVPLDALWAEGGTVATLAGMIRSLGSATTGSRLVTLRAGDGTQPPLFVIHTVRGSVNEYQAFASYLSSGAAVIGVRSKGLFGDPIPRPDLVEYAQDCVEAILREYPNGPYRLIGFSIGGRIAFECAMQMRALNLEVDFLGMIDTQAPGFVFRPELNVIVARKWTGAKRRLNKLLPGAAYVDEDREREEAAERDAQNPVVADVDVSLLSQRVRALYVSLLEAEDTYRPTAVCDVPMHLFVARFASRADREALLGWGSLAAGGVVVHSLSAPAHLDVMTPRYARSLAELVAMSLPAHPRSDLRLAPADEGAAPSASWNSQPEVKST